MTALEWIAKARKVMETDAHLATYMVRDLPETKAAGLDGLAWAMHREPPSRNDVTFLLNKLEKYIMGEEA